MTRPILMTLLACLLCVPTTAFAADGGEAPQVTGLWLSADTFVRGDLMSMALNVSGQDLRYLQVDLLHDDGASSVRFFRNWQNGAQIGTNVFEHTWTAEHPVGNWSVALVYTEDMAGHSRWTDMRDAFPQAARFTLTGDAALPDVVVSDLALTPDAGLRDGDVVRVDATVRNVGAGRADAFVAEITSEGTLLGRMTLGPFEPGAGATMTTWFRASAGMHAVEAAVDVDGTLAESDEGNNQATRSYAASSAAMPNLVVNAVEITPAWNVTEGDTLRVDAIVENAGDAAAGAFQVRLTMDNGTLLGAAELVGLDAGARTTVTTWFTAQAGAHDVVAYADADERVAESSERDNQGARSYWAARAPGSAQPDLVLVDLVLSTPRAQPGENVYIEARLANEGNAPAGRFAVRFYLDDNAYAVGWFDGLAAGAATAISTGWSATEGNHTFTAVVDADGEVAESAEWNNKASRPIWVDSSRALPNLVVTSLQANPAGNLTDGEWMSLDAVVTNQGQGASPETAVQLFLDGGLVADVRIGALEPGQSTSATAWLVATEGFHSARAVVDPADAVAEESEWDNAVELPFFVQPRAPPVPRVDLAVRILGVAHEPVRTDLGSFPVNPLGRRFVTVEVVNEGDAVEHALLALDATSRTRPTGVSSAVAVGSMALGPLAPGERTVVTFEWQPRAAVGDVTFVARVTSPAPDADPQDNRATYDDFLVVGGLGGLVLL